ncbi:MAG: hypothetical protein HC883_01085 [Bdellovibrionaceae bacterium]|nr:hypothetical protein [Pseudobdellovibrionaceae bacterium]
MGLFEDLEDQARQLYDAKRNEIGKYVGDFFGQAISNAARPVQQPSSMPAPVASAVAAATPYMKYALPLAALIGVVMLLRKKGG